MCKVLGLIPKDDDAKEVNVLLEKLYTNEVWKELNGLIAKSKVQLLNNKEYARYGKVVGECCEIFINHVAQIVVCTIAQLNNNWVKDVKFDIIIVDEATKMSEAQLVQVWRNESILITLGDQTQPGPTRLSKPKDNPMVEQSQMSFFERQIEIGYPYCLFREVMRSTAGLEVLHSTLFYEGKLQPGQSTSLDDGTRKMSAVWKKAIHARYPSSKQEPQGLVYPVFVDIKSESEPEMSGDSSRINLANAAAVTEHLIWVVENNIAGPSDIGIATPYAGQVTVMLDITRKLTKDKPEHDWRSVRVGTTDWWAGRQAPYMIVDLVRGSNDHAELGYMSAGRRLNVLISRQEQALVVFGDKECTKPVVTGNKEIDRSSHARRNNTNRQVIKMFDWLQKKGRRVEASAKSLAQDYVQFTPPAEPSDYDAEPDTIDTSGASDWATPAMPTGNASTGDSSVDAAGGGW